MHTSRLLAALLTMIALSGCLTSEPDDGLNINVGIPEDCDVLFVDSDSVNVVAPDETCVIPPLLDDGLVNTEAYDYWDFNLTNFRTESLTKVGHEPLRYAADGSPDPHRYLGELDMRGDLDLGAVQVNGNGETPGVYLLDISDRADPEVISFIEQGGTYVVDVKISDDGDFLFTASQNLPASICIPDRNDPDINCRPEPDTSGVREDPATPNGFTIYDISDPAAPTHLQTVESPDGLGCHMLSHEVIDDTDVVFCVGDDIHAYGFVRAADGQPWVELGRFTYNVPDSDARAADSPSGCVGEPYALAIVGGEPSAAGDNFCSGPHDMTVAEDPVDGRILMTASHWDEGLRIVDVSQPIPGPDGSGGFVTLASWKGDGAKHYDGNIHTAMTFWVGDKRYTVATPEMTYNGVTPAVWVLDATDLGDGSEVKQLELVAEWYHPLEYKTPGLIMTTHQWQVAPTGPDASIGDTNIYITMNHLGVWVLDFEEILGGDLAGAIGGFHMSREPLDPAEESGAAVYSTWDVGVVDGYIYGTDRATGLWVFDYTQDAPDDERLRGFA